MGYNPDTDDNSWLDNVLANATPEQLAAGFAFVDLVNDAFEWNQPKEMGGESASYSLIGGDNDDPIPRLAEGNYADFDNPTQVENFLYDVGNPGAAVRNYLRNRGQPINPFNQGWNRLLNTFAAGLLPQYYAGLVNGGETDFDYAGRNFRNFIHQRWTGSMAPPSYSDARTIMGQLNQLIRQARSGLDLVGTINAERAQQGLPPLDLTKKDDRNALEAAMQEKGGVGMGVLPLSVAMQMSTPDEQAAMLLAAYLPSLGPTLSEGLNKALQIQLRDWNDYYQYVDPMKNFLDLITGSWGI